MADRVRVQLPVRDILLSRYVTSHLGQLSLAIPTWVGAVSTSQKGGDALRLTRKDRYGSRVCLWQVKLCPCYTRAMSFFEV